MKAIICDMCGAIVLLEDDAGQRTAGRENMYILKRHHTGDILELCEDCGKAILEKAREIRTSVKMEG